MGNSVPRASMGYTVTRADPWAFAGTGLRYGDLFGTRDASVVYEVDGCDFSLSPEDGLPVPTGDDGRPEDLAILATAPASLPCRTEEPSRYRSADRGDREDIALARFGDDSPTTLRGLAHNHAVMGTYTRGGTVFSTGTTDWVYGLAGHDPAVERITRNVLDRLLDR